MLIFRKIKDIENHLKSLKKEGLKVGFTPTMGALHAGHVALIKTSKKECDVTVCSIFVNPTQFNERSDYKNYPVTINKDIEILQDAGCDILFLPRVKEMYPIGFQNNTPINFGFIAETLEGERRPGHFNGMAQIVDKLLNIIKPNKLYMGQKDYQQQLIVGQIIKKRRFNTQLVMCPITREKNGLAMSSRNMRLDEDSRKAAAEISKTLKRVKSEVKKLPGFKAGKKAEIRKIQQKAFAYLSSIKGIRPEYFEIRNAHSLRSPQRNSEKLIALAAVKIGGVRLIDNMLLN